MIISITQVYIYTSVNDMILQIVSKAYGFEVASLLRYIEEYDMYG